MKKVIFAFVIAAALTACGSNNTTNVAVADSTATSTDSTAKVDSTIAPTADTTATK